jgi:hypothetical protein
MRMINSCKSEDGAELRAKILSLTSSEAKRLGIPKQSLHDLRIKSRSGRSFKLYAGTREKLAETSGQNGGQT